MSRRDTSDCSAATGLITLFLVGTVALADGLYAVVLVLEAIR